MDFRIIPYNKTADTIRAAISFLPPATESNHIVSKGEAGLFVDTKRKCIVRKNELSNDRKCI